MIYRHLLNEPFGKTPAYVDSLTDRELYAWHFRKYDKEADMLEAMTEQEQTEAEKTMEQKHDEHIALCRSFGHTDAQAEEAWAEWLAEQGA